MTPNQAFDQWLIRKNLHRVNLSAFGPDALAHIVQDAFLAGAASSTPIWQPMDTAPKDGTPVLIKDARGVRIASWRGIHGYEKVNKAWCIVGSGQLRDSSDCEWYETTRPTGWMPLPSP